MTNERKTVFTGMYKPIIGVISLNSLLMYCLIFIFWLATEGMDNAYDSTDGFPVFLDLILICALILNTAMSFVLISWILALRPKSIYDDWQMENQPEKVHIPNNL